MYTYRVIDGNLVEWNDLGRECPLELMEEVFNSFNIAKQNYPEFFEGQGISWTDIKYIRAVTQDFKKKKRIYAFNKRHDGAVVVSPIKLQESFE